MAFSTMTPHPANGSYRAWRRRDFGMAPSGQPASGPNQTGVGLPQRQRPHLPPRRLFPGPRGSGEENRGRRLPERRRKLVIPRLKGSRISDYERTPESATSTSVEANGEDHAEQDRSLSFTPLRSYVTRAQACTTEAEGAPALSLIVPAPRPQS